MELTQKDIYEVMNNFNDDIKDKFKQEMIIHKIKSLNDIISIFENEDNVYFEGNQMILLYTKDMLDEYGHIKKYDPKNYEILDKIFKERLIVYVYPINTELDNNILYYPYDKEFTTTDIIRKPTLSKIYKLYNDMKNIN